LQKPTSGTKEDPHAVVLDLNTAMWSLHLKAQINEVFSFSFKGREVYFKTVGLLNNSLLQGMLLIGEQNFQVSFPDLSGFQFFLATEMAKTPSAAAGSLTRQQLADTLEKGWGDEGLDMMESDKVLEQLLAVQNTYLKAFQSLGALGLLLGTLGLAIVQIRSVLERRSELAILRAIGFNPSRIGKLILLENCLLLLGGIMVGGVTAIVCVTAPLLQNAQFTELLQPLAWLGVVIVVGLVAGSFAVRTAARQPLLSALRQR
jgi:ABC-type antimicrobial peptide transport system permease subunit